MATTCYNNENPSCVYTGGPLIYLGLKIIITESIYWFHDIGEPITVWIIISLRDSLMTGSSDANQEFSNKSIINIMIIILQRIRSLNEGAKLFSVENFRVYKDLMGT